jgi:hypothetical protein
MRIRGVHVAVGIIALLAMFMVIVSQRYGQPVTEDKDIVVGGVPPVTKGESRHPKLEVETTTFDVGVISNQEPTKRKLRFFNRGNSELKIIDIQTSCACTVGEVSPERALVPPGGESYIDVTVNPFRIPGFSSHKVLTITSNDLSKKSITVDVIAKVDPEFDLIPPEIDFGQIQKGATPETTVIVRQHNDVPLEVKAVGELKKENKESSSDVSDLTVSMEKRPEASWATPGKAEYQFSVKLLPTVPPGKFNQYISISTNQKRLLVMPYLLKANVSAFYQLDPAPPDALKLTTSPGNVTKGTLSITADRPIDITDIETDAPFLSASVRKGDIPNKVCIDVTVNPDAPNGLLNQSLSYVVRAGEEKYPERAKIQAVVKGK